MGEHPDRRQYGGLSTNPADIGKMKQANFEADFSADYNGDLSADTSADYGTLGGEDAHPSHEGSLTPRI